jgi:hypothetical protein
VVAAAIAVTVVGGPRQTEKTVPSSTASAYGYEGMPHNHNQVLL